MAFDVATRTKALLWCDRHCCLCKKSCGTNIEVHHVVPVADGGTDEADNAMPLCFECHAKVQHYNTEHPRGNKFKPEELKARREQVYEEQTRHLVPPIHYGITNLLNDGQTKREFPDVGFNLRHCGDSLPVHVRTVLTVTLDENGLAPLEGHYAGEKLWRLNPRFAHLGHFSVPEESVEGDGRIEIEARVTVIDTYEREHDFLPVGYVYNRDGDYWYFEP